MNFFVSGGAGFIGGHLCESLLADGNTVYAMDNFSTGSKKNIERILSHKNFHFVEDDIITSGKLPEMIEKSDIIFHLAAVVGVELVVRDPVGTILTNVNGSERVLSLASEYGKRIFLASTSEVYGKSDKLPFSEKDDLVIGPSTHSRWSYACSKLLDEFLLMAYHRNKNLNGTVVRFFNTVGPRQTGEYGMVIPRFVNAALKGESLKVYGSGKQTRCFCHVFDTVRALKMLASKENIAGRIFNIGGTESISMEDLAAQTIETLGSDSKIERISYEQAYEHGFEDMLHRKPDVSAIQESIGWKAEIPLKQIIRDVAAESTENSNLL